MVTSRSIDEVIVVNSSSNFNGTNFLNNQASQVISVKNTLNSSNVGLSFAFANERSASLGDNFYNWLAQNNITFFNDPSLESLSSGLVLESNSVSNGEINGFDAVSSFSTILSNNILWEEAPSSTPLALGDGFGSKPSITVSTPTFLSDLSDSISVVISAEQFSKLLSTEDIAQNFNLDNPSNLTVSPQLEAAVMLSPNSGNYYKLQKSEVSAGYDGTNRLGNLKLAQFDENSTTGTLTASFYWDEVDPILGVEQIITLNVSQALMLPLMGAATYKNKVVLKDTAENLSAGLQGFTQGQINSFNEIEIEDNASLTLDAETFFKLDTGRFPDSAGNFRWVNHDGVSLVNTDGTQAKIKVTGSFDNFVNNNLFTVDSSANGGSFATTLTTSTDAANLVSLIDQKNIVNEIDGSTDSLLSSNLTKLNGFLRALSGQNFTSNFTFSAATNNISSQSFLLLSELDSLSPTQNIISENFASGLTISDTAENIKALITNTSSSVVDSKQYISNISIIGSENNLLTLSWEEYLGALGSSNADTSFDITDPSTYATSVTALKNLSSEFNLVVVGTSSEINTIINTYGDTINNLPAALTFKISDDSTLSLTQAQLDQLDAKIDGLVNISDTSEGIGKLLDNAISPSIKSITSTDTFVISFDQFRNLPNYYSGDVVISDTEDSIVGALQEDLLDDRVTTLVITSPSTSIGNTTLEGTTVPALTVTAAAAANILGKKVYSSADYPSNSSSYMQINVVDRGSAIANFIENATIPGEGTISNDTGLINFVEVDNQSIKLDYNQNLAYEALKASGVLASNLISTPVTADITLQTILNKLNELDTDLDNVKASIIADTGATETALTSSIASAQASIIANTDIDVEAIIADTGATEAALTSSIAAAQSAIIADTGATETALTSSIASAESAIIADTGATEATLSALVSSARAAIIADTGATESALSNLIAAAQASIIADTGATENTVISELSAQAINTRAAVELAKTSIIADTGATENALEALISTAKASIIADTGATETTISNLIETAKATIIADTGLTETALTSSIAAAQSAIIANTDLDVAAAQTALTSSIVSAQASIAANTDAAETALTSSIVSAQASIIADTGATETALTSSIVSAQTSIEDNTDAVGLVIIANTDVEVAAAQAA
ncbi:MAG: hypothetical protein CMD04_05410, partial [Flavobacteriales bacterium]|nr:hypothetical protein [Flavobacteriales bacterium]